MNSHSKTLKSFFVFWRSINSPLKFVFQITKPSSKALKEWNKISKRSEEMNNITPSILISLFNNNHLQLKSCCCYACLANCFNVTTCLLYRGTIFQYFVLCQTLSRSTLKKHKKNCTSGLCITKNYGRKIKKSKFKQSMLLVFSCKRF